MSLNLATGAAYSAQSAQRTLSAAEIEISSKLGLDVEDYLRARNSTDPLTPVVGDLTPLEMAIAGELGINPGKYLAAKRKVEQLLKERA